MADEWNLRGRVKGVPPIVERAQMEGVTDVTTHSQARREPSEPTRIAAIKPIATGYKGQLTAGEITDILRENRASAAQARSDFLKAHPHYMACSVAGCEGLVGPNFQRLTPDGTKYGFCPRRQVHARLMPDVFPGR